MDLPKDVLDTTDLYGRHRHQPSPGSPHEIDLDGYDYRWLRVRRSGDRRVAPPPG